MTWEQLPRRTAAGQFEPICSGRGKGLRYVEVDSIDDHLARIGTAGGRTITPRTVIPDTVIFALFADPVGNMVGLIEPGDATGS